MRHGLNILALAFVFLVGSGWSAPDKQPAEGDFSLLWSRRLVWLKANDAPVNAILTAIGLAGGISIHLDEDNEERVTLDLFFEIRNGEDVEPLILSVWPSAAMIYEHDAGSGGLSIVHVKAMKRVTATQRTGRPERPERTGTAERPQQRERGSATMERPARGERPARETTERGGRR